MGVTALLAALDPAAYRPHPLHLGDRVWSETNCYVDLWIEVLHALGMEPLAVCACAFDVGFDGDQWTFFKVAHDDLRDLFGIEVAELNVWRPIVEHIELAFAADRLLAVDVDAFHLPDTAGVSYGTEHVKTSIVPTAVDARARRIRYFHNAGLHEAGGPDYEGAVGETARASNTLAPYVESVELTRGMGVVPDAATVLDVARRHARRIPVSDPVRAMQVAMEGRLEWLVAADSSVFHAYAFGTCRQCGASAQTAERYVSWLEDRGAVTLPGVADAYRELSEAAKSLEFALARAARGRGTSLDGIFDTMSAAWGRSAGVVRDVLGG